ncbi:unnamed protein product [Spirodela intermedia]|uniref:Uncharacterized protein n=1 Tax=Spirodela intermedia TaxID=51605 RepID=A0A7I8JS87_SPIIN|nr:unnamed protein product [Spirodela intermedia]CAA6673077.1 unnamed protein product [Spirodela intermedia]
MASSAATVEAIGPLRQRGMIQLSRSTFGAPYTASQSPRQQQTISRSPLQRSTSLSCCISALSARCATGETQSVTRKSKEKLAESPRWGNNRVPPADGGGEGGGGGGGSASSSGGFFFFGLLLFLSYLREKEDRENGGGDPRRR